MDKPFDKTSVPFGEEGDEIMEPSADLAQLVSGYFQPGELIEDVSMFDVECLLEEVLLEPPQYDEAGVMRYRLSNGTLSIRPLYPTQQKTVWTSKTTTDALHFEFQAADLLFFDFKSLSELNLRFKFIRVLINNSDRLCFCFSLLLRGVSSEHLLSVIRHYITELLEVSRLVTTMRRLDKPLKQH
ncbi:hypothetical protein [Pseudoalteromonas rubra]|uniref:Uncharacterized protein n=1 Tax=Pseudoalteromonas rubra TaxID=43658 RepID=A0A0U3HTB2_9GAMM|nr:hypothetical protein [Pseudoalteromonas rubra]ALU46165.1 hypothetical protein AT705_24695 [Pseudoalteromonas rubra]